MLSRPSAYQKTEKKIGIHTTSKCSLVFQCAYDPFQIPIFTDSRKDIILNYLNQSASQIILEFLCYVVNQLSVMGEGSLYFWCLLVSMVQIFPPLQNSNYQISTTGLQTYCIFNSGHSPIWKALGHRWLYSTL